MLVADKVKKFFHSIGIHSVTVQYECEDDQQTLLLSQNNSNSQSKIVGDCLLRCENNACDTQTCCTITSARSETLLNSNNDNTLETYQIIIDESIEKF
jgi:hypothetical protein